MKFEADKFTLFLKTVGCGLKKEKKGKPHCR